MASQCRFSPMTRTAVRGRWKRMTENSNNLNNKSDIINLRRSQLVKAAYKVVSKKGFYNFTIRDIAREAKLSTGLVHYYFKNKQDLLVNLLKEVNDNLKRYLNSGLSGSTDPVEKLEIFIRQAFNLVNVEKDYFSIIFDFWTQINRSERMRRANIKLFQSYRDECSSILQEGIEKGVYVEMDVSYTTTIIISVIQGLIIQYVIDNNAFNYEEYTGKAIRHIKTLVLKKNQ